MNMLIGYGFIALVGFLAGWAIYHAISWGEGIEEITTLSLGGMPLWDDDDA